jgi:hypothetical protein
MGCGRMNLKGDAQRISDFLIPRYSPEVAQMDAGNQ